MTFVCTKCEDEKTTKNHANHMGLKFIDVDEGTVSRFSYDEKTNLLTVVFRSNGEAYEYSHVPTDVYKSFAKAESKGSYLQKNLRGKYTYVRAATRDHAFGCSCDECKRHMVRCKVCDVVYDQRDNDYVRLHAH